MVIQKVCVTGGKIEEITLFVSYLEVNGADVFGQVVLEGSLVGALVALAQSDAWGCFSSLFFLICGTRISRIGF